MAKRKTLADRLVEAFQCISEVCTHREYIQLFQKWCAIVAEAKRSMKRTHLARYRYLLQDGSFMAWDERTNTVRGG